MLFIGIDVSKLSFNVAVLSDDKYHNNKFDNNEPGFNALFQWLAQFPGDKRFCMKSAGIYGVALAEHIYHSKYKVVVENPKAIQDFAVMAQVKNKTDQIDAQIIAKYCEYLDDTHKYEQMIFKPQSEDRKDLRELVVRLDQLNQSLTSEQYHLEVSGRKRTQKMIKSHIEYLEKQINEVETALDEIVKQNAEIAKQVEYLTSINGIGKNTAYAILAYLGDITNFDSAKQVVAYAGFNPSIKHLDSSAKIGDHRLHKALYMSAMVAIRHNPLLKEFYERLVKNGKPEKVALRAVVRKLLVISYSVLKLQQPFDVNYAKSKVD